MIRSTSEEEEVRTKGSVCLDGSFQGSHKHQSHGSHLETSFYPAVHWKCRGRQRWDFVPCIIANERNAHEMRVSK